MRSLTAALALPAPAIKGARVAQIDAAAVTVFAATSRKVALHKQTKQFVASASLEYLRSGPARAAWERCGFGFAQ